MKPEYNRTKKNRRCNVNINIIDISDMNKNKDEWKTKKVTDIIVFIKIRFIVSTLIRYKLQY
jgi:hypothetical protein